MFTLNNVSSAVLRKGQDPSGMGCWTFLTILGKNNSRTTIFTMYRPCKGQIETVGDTTIIKQQWLIMQQTKKRSSTTSSNHRHHNCNEQKIKGKS